MTRSPTDPRRNFRTWLLGHVLLAACTAPPRAEPPPPARIAPLAKFRVSVAAPGLSAEELAAQVVPALERALAPIPEVDALVSRADDGRATVVAVVTNPDAADSLRDALTTVQRDLPPSLAPPLLTRAVDEPPALALRVAAEPDIVESLKHRIQRTPGVGRVELCGGRERAIHIDLDRRRLAAVPLDRVVKAFHQRLDVPLGGDATVLARRPTPPGVEQLAELAIPDTELRLRDIATVAVTGPPRACADLLDPTHTTLLVHPQYGVDRRTLAADIPLAELRAALPPAAGPLTAAPEAAGTELAVLELELHWPPDKPSPYRCLSDAAAAPLFLVRRDPASSDQPIRARLLLAVPSPGPATPAATRPIEHVRETLSRCAGITRVAVLAPEADADHLASVELLGPDPADLAGVADEAADRLGYLPGVTLLRVHAARPRPVEELRIDRAAAADRGVRMDDLADVVRLASGPLEVGDVDGVPVFLDLFERPGSVEQALPELSVSSPGGPVPLAALVSVSGAPSSRAPLYRIAQSNAAAIELRLRRAADREAVILTATDIRLPTGVQLRFGREFPPMDP